jgi:hypothetical protein
MGRQANGLEESSDDDDAPADVEEKSGDEGASEDDAEVDDDESASGDSESEAAIDDDEASDEESEESEGSEESCEDDEDAGANAYYDVDGSADPYIDSEASEDEASEDETVAMGREADHEESPLSTEPTAAPDASSNTLLQTAPPGRAKASRARPTKTRVVNVPRKQQKRPVQPAAPRPPRCSREERLRQRKKGAMEGVRRSAVMLSDAAKSVKDAIDATWRAGTRAPMMLPRPAEGQKLQRTHRLIRRTAVTAALSLAAAEAISEVRQLCIRFEQPMPRETPSAPWLPALPDGSLLMIEQTMAAYMQETLWYASQVCGGTDAAQRITLVGMRHGAETADRLMFGGDASFAMDGGRVWVA